jgi:hypothetical protein
MFNSRDFLRAEYNVLSKNVTRDVSQSEITLSEAYNKMYGLSLLLRLYMTQQLYLNTREYNTILKINKKTVSMLLVNIYRLQEQLK